MSEQRWRANLISATVDEIEIVNETPQFVDVKRPARSGWAATIQREAKETGYSQICKSNRQAWEAIEAYTERKLASAEETAASWRRHFQAVRVQADAARRIIEKPDVTNAP